MFASLEGHVKFDPGETRNKVGNFSFGNKFDAASASASEGILTKA